MDIPKLLVVPERDQSKIDVFSSPMVIDGEVGSTEQCGWYTKPLDAVEGAHVKANGAVKRGEEVDDKVRMSVGGSVS